MSRQLHDELRALRDRQQPGTKPKGEDQPVFGLNGKCRAQNSVRKAFKAYLKKAGLPEIRVHDMRHTFATLLINRGVNLAQIKDLLGHSSIKTTVDIYGHFIVKSQASVVSLLDPPAANNDSNNSNQ